MSQKWLCRAAPPRRRRLLWNRPRACIRAARCHFRTTLYSRAPPPRQFSRPNTRSASSPRPWPRSAVVEREPCDLRRAGAGRGRRGQRGVDLVVGMPTIDRSGGRGLCAARRLEAPVIAASRRLRLRCVCGCVEAFVAVLHARLAEPQWCACGSVGSRVGGRGCSLRAGVLFLAQLRYVTDPTWTQEQ